jgi:hypothetical protein
MTTGGMLHLPLGSVSELYTYLPLMYIEISKKEKSQLVLTFNI